ncbi:hypothetical protein Cgig2_028728 [Carnegiea gigantea]|uniref:LOB domain-containing protein n=1 Tax=Carnegiea gigantea TaxID=171969 RepID=A0A9Q1KBU1_9CARY|nr:hypothetical protein Cgig2_028728 [Carnegiea gigantea]
MNTKGEKAQPKTQNPTIPTELPTTNQPINAPPPTLRRRVPPPNYRENSRQCCSCRCCCMTLFWAALIATALLAAAAVATASFYAYYRPRPPSFFVSSLTFTHLNLTSAVETTAKMNLTVTASNPNGKITFLYDSINVTVAAHRGKIIMGRGNFPQFVQWGKNTTELFAQIESVEDFGDQDFRIVKSDLKNNKGLDLTVKMETQMRLKIGERMKTGELGLRVSCSRINTFASSNRNLTDEYAVETSVHGAKKCAPDCVLAPYFPHDRTKQFLNAHKLFGVSNITKIIRNLNPPDKDIAMRTIMYQSDMRAKDPVGGCFRIIRDLHHQIEYYKAELDVVLQQLAICKAQQAYHHQAQAQVQTQPQAPTQTQQTGQFMQAMAACPPTAPAPAAPPPPPSPASHHQHAQVGPAADHQLQGEGDVIQATPLSSDPNDYQDQYQALMRCYYDHNQDQSGHHQEYTPVQVHHSQQEDEPQPQHHTLQYLWGGAGDQESMLASSNSCTTNNNNHHYIIRGSDLVRSSDHHQDQCGAEFQVVKHQPQMMHQINNVCASSYNDETDFGSKFDDHHVDVSCSDIHTDNDLKFDSQQTTELSEEVLLKDDHKVILELQEDDSFHYHHIPEHDLRSAATLFTLN